MPVSACGKPLSLCSAILPEQTSLCHLPEYSVLTGEYPYEHPLTNPIGRLLREVDEEGTDTPRARPKMPPESGIEEPLRKRTSDNPGSSSN